MKLAVVIPAYGHLPDILRCLNSLRTFSADVANVDYFVQDDASPEVDLRECIPPEIADTVRNETNLGFAANCNAGAAQALKYNPDVLFFVNQDISAVSRWSGGWDEALLNAFYDPLVGIVGARLLFENGSIQSAGGVFDQLGQPVHRCLGWSNPDNGMGGKASEVDWTTGAAIAIRASLFRQLGGFDEGYARGYFEDVSICIRAREAGARIWYEPACTLIHRVGSTGGSPYFAQNARRFKQEFVDSGRIKAGVLQPVVRYW